jgi:alkanesulfonate monooxygenase SsuD/methylene tetrahydromethanopterin reductase-like flavin-dependent oxidoreductase (luciferase family)
MPIKVWTFAFNAIAGRAMPSCDDEVAVQHAFDRNLEQHASLEDIGFEGVFFSEHHFLNSLSPNPNLLVPALAQRTKTLKIGVLGNVLAFHQPWRLAEDLAMLDYLTGGRLEIGFAGGISTELSYVGISPEDARAMFAEALDIIELAWREETVTYRGRFWTLDAVPILPRMRSETRRRKWLTLYSENTARLAARRGYKICTAFQSVDATKRLYDFYRDEAARIGYAISTDAIGLRRQVLLWDDDASAARLHAEVQDASRARINDIHSQLEARRAAGGAVPAKVNLLDGLLDPASEFLFGAPRTVADMIVDQCRRVGAGHFVAYHPAALTEQELAHHYELWREVIPLFEAA